ncbi:MAG: hypothetical protein ACOCUO_00535 [archaeon]
MDRRKFIVGLGAAATGGSALIGTGAFSRVESQRQVTIEVAEDPDAYLGLDKCDTPNGSYVDMDSDGHLVVLMNPENEHHPDDDLGAGVNSDSRTWFDNVFQICNQGKEAAAVYIEDHEDWPTWDGEGAVDEKDGEERRVQFYFKDQRERSMIGRDNAELVQVGDCICVGIRTTTHELDTSEVETLLDDLDDTIQITADVDEPVEDGPVWNETQGTTYQTIQAAVDDADEGDLIKVFADGNPYEEMVEVDVDSLTIKGLGRPTVRAPDDFGGSGGTPNIEVTATNVTVEGLDIDTRGVGGNVPSGLALEGDGGTARDNVVRYSDSGANGQGFISGGGDDILIEDNEAEDTVMAYWGSGDAEFTGNEFIGPKIDEALWSTTEGSLTIEDNVFTDASPGAAMVKLTEDTVEVNGETGGQDIADSICAENTDVVDVEVDGTTYDC